MMWVLGEGVGGGKYVDDGCLAFDADFELLFCHDDV